jgi:hypothetical protein
MIAAEIGGGTGRRRRAKITSGGAGAFCSKPLSERVKIRNHLIDNWSFTIGHWQLSFASTTAQWPFANSQ